MLRIRKGPSQSLRILCLKLWRRWVKIFFQSKARINVVLYKIFLYNYGYTICVYTHKGLYKKRDFVLPFPLHLRIPAAKSFFGQSFDISLENYLNAENKGQHWDRRTGLTTKDETVKTTWNSLNMTYLIWFNSILSAFLMIGQKKASFINIKKQTEQN